MMMMMMMMIMKGYITNMQQQLGNLKLAQHLLEGRGKIRKLVLIRPVKEHLQYILTSRQQTSK
jgi:hypothetical protein